jgi:hypothetical protein
MVIGENSGWAAALLLGCDGIFSRTGIKGAGADVERAETSTLFRNEDPDAGRCSTGPVSVRGGPSDPRLGICGSSLRTGNCGVNSSVLRSKKTFA